MWRIFIIALLTLAFTHVHSQTDGTIKVRKKGCDVVLDVKLSKGRTNYEKYSELRYVFEITPKGYMFSQLIIKDPAGNSVYAVQGIRHTFYVNRKGQGPQLPSGEYSWEVKLMDECEKVHVEEGTFQMVYPE